MQTELDEYSPQPLEKRKIFELTPATDPVTTVILAARKQCLRMPKAQLSWGAKCLFTLLLDLSLDPYRNVRGIRGVVDISVPELCYHLNCSRGVLFGGRRSESEPGWIEQLVRARFVWISPGECRNDWPVNRYHILALDDPKSPAQTPSRDGLRKNTRRGPAPIMGLDQMEPEKAAHVRSLAAKARGVVQNVQCQNGGDVSHLVENERPTLRKVNARRSEKTMPGVGESPTPGVQEVQRPAFTKDNAGRSGSPTPGVGKKPTPAVQEGQHFRETPVLDSERAISKSQSTSKSYGRAGSGRNSREREFLERVCVFIGKKNFERFGGQWTARFREDPSRAQAVLADAVATKREGGVHSNPGGFMNSLWVSKFGLEPVLAGKAVGK